MGFPYGSFPIPGTVRERTGERTGDRGHDGRAVPDMRSDEAEVAGRSAGRRASAGRAGQAYGWAMSLAGERTHSERAGGQTSECRTWQTGKRAGRKTTEIRGTSAGHSGQAGGRTCGRTAERMGSGYQLKVVCDNLTHSLLATFVSLPHPAKKLTHRICTMYMTPSGRG